MAQTPLHSFSESLKSTIQLNSKQITYQKGDLVVDIGEPIKGLPYVVNGLLKVYKEDDDDHEFFMYFLHPGDVCSMGLQCCLKEGRSMARVYAEEDSAILFMPSNTIQELKGNLEWNQFVIQSLTQRIEDLTNVANQLAFKNLDQRVLDHLLKLSEEKKSTTIETSHREISNDLNSSREVISRVLKKMEKEGKLQMSRNVIILNK